MSDEEIEKAVLYYIIFEKEECERTIRLSRERIEKYKMQRSDVLI